MNIIKKLLVGAFCALALMVSSHAAITQPDDSWTFTLSGAGATTTADNSQTAFGTDLSIGHTGKILLPVEFGVRQAFAYNTEGKNATFNTGLFTDWTLFSFYRFDVFAGANIGFAYGDISSYWTVAPEAGIRYYLKKDVAIVGRADYPFNLNEGNWNDTLRYTLGVRVSW